MSSLSVANASELLLLTPTPPPAQPRGFTGLWAAASTSASNCAMFPHFEFVPKSEVCTFYLDVGCSVRSRGVTPPHRRNVRHVVWWRPPSLPTCSGALITTHTHTSSSHKSGCIPKITYLKKKRKALQKMRRALRLHLTRCSGKVFKMADQAG